jgi:hypothetical protein
MFRHGASQQRKEALMSAQVTTYSENLLRIVFGVVLCAGYVYVVFFFFFMFRTVLFPSLFGNGG